MSVRFLQSDAGGGHGGPTGTLARLTAVMLPALALVFALAVWRWVGQLPRPPDMPPLTEPPARELAGEHPAAAWSWSVFQSLTDVPPVDTGAALERRYRLAGTFFASGGRRHARKAIIDDLERRDQRLVGEGDLLDETLVVRSIQPDHIIVMTPAGEQVLRLSFSGAAALADIGAAAGTEDGAAGMLSRFGKRVEDRRWLLKRDALLEYYREVMQDTERLARVFASFKPVYQASRIAGYVLDIEGEKEMFHAFGLRQNDVIRTVNSMPMTSQTRAEYFIREFVMDRVNGFVLEFERDGKPQRFVYLVR